MIGATSRNRQTPKSELLTREDEYDLIQRARAGEEAAKNCLIRKNRGLIKKVVNRFSSRVDRRVLVTAGELAVIIAINKFDLSTGNRFSTYLVPTIRSEVRDCFCRETGITRNTLENLEKISKASSALSQELGREPTLEEIIERSELSKRQILNAWENKAFSQPLSFNQKLNEDCPEWLDSQIDETVDPWKQSEDIEILDTLDQLESDGHLQSRQVTILIAKYQGYNNREVGEELDVSRERVRQLLKDAAGKLSAFASGTLNQIKKTISVSTHHTIEPIGEDEELSLDLPISEEVSKPALKRVDASRLGGRIRRATNQLSNQTQESLDYQLGELTHVAKPILAFRRCSDHRIAPKSGHQPSSTNQRCHRLGGIQDAWGGYLEIGQEILSVFLIPLAFAYLAIRGFQNNRLYPTRRSKMHSIATDVFKFLGTGYRREHPRPPNHWPDIDEDSS